MSIFMLTTMGRERGVTTLDIVLQSNFCIYIPFNISSKPSIVDIGGRSDLVLLPAASDFGFIVGRPFSVAYAMQLGRSAVKKRVI